MLLVESVDVVDQYLHMVSLHEKEEQPNGRYKGNTTYGGSTLIITLRRHISLMSLLFDGVF